MKTFDKITMTIIAILTFFIVFSANYDKDSVPIPAINILFGIVYLIVFTHFLLILLKK